MFLLLILTMGFLSRLAGGGFFAPLLNKLGVNWLPELLFALPFGLAFGSMFTGYVPSIVATAFAWAWSYVFMQSATWSFLDWTGEEGKDYGDRSFTLKPIVDFIAKKFGFKLGDEGYSWISAGVKGFLIGLPVGGFSLAILWPLGYEIGSHFKGRVEKYGLDPHAFSEFFAGMGAGVAICLFLLVV